jgi:hypothetical protein
MPDQYRDRDPFEERERQAEQEERAAVEKEQRDMGQFFEAVYYVRDLVKGGKSIEDLRFSYVNEYEKQPSDAVKIYVDAEMKEQTKPTNRSDIINELFDQVKETPSQEK